MARDGVTRVNQDTKSGLWFHGRSNKILHHSRILYLFFISIRPMHKLNYKLHVI